MHQRKECMSERKKRKEKEEKGKTEGGPQGDMCFHHAQVDREGSGEGVCAEILVKLRQGLFRFKSVIRNICVWSLWWNVRLK